MMIRNLLRNIRDVLGGSGLRGELMRGGLGSLAVKVEFRALMQAGGGYDYVLNLSALKHVRSEKDPFTLMRLIEVNIHPALAPYRPARICGLPAAKSASLGSPRPASGRS